jgi:hypothetical protein
MTGTGSPSCPTSSLERRGTSSRELLTQNILDSVGMADSVPGQDVLDDRATWASFLDAEHARRYEAGLARLAKPYRLQGTETVRGLYGYWPESFSSLYVKLPERKLALILLANSDGLSAPFFLGAGDVTRSPFAGSFLRIFEREASLGRALLDPRWSQSSDGFNAEIERLTAQAGNYRYDAEKGSHELLTRWLDERRRAAPK